MFKPSDFLLAFIAFIQIKLEEPVELEAGAPLNYIIVGGVY